MRSGKGRMTMMKTGCLLFRAEGEDISGFLTLAADYDLTIQKFCKADGICLGYLPPREYRTATGPVMSSTARRSIRRSSAKLAGASTVMPGIWLR